jgi:membrane protein DedA with SNARE-associated domain
LTLARAEVVSLCKECMTDIVRFVESHGYSILFAVIFVRQVGVPLPGFPFLLAAGALASAGRLDFFAVFTVAVCACVLADWIWYEAGLQYGERTLHFLHRHTRDPEMHDRRAKRLFARYGLPLLLVAKFVPLLDAVAPPLAGASRARRLRFLGFDAGGSSLYASVFAGLGYAFSHDLGRAASYVSQAGRLLLCVVLAGACIYIAVNLVRQRGRLGGSQQEQMTSTDPRETGICGDLPHGMVQGEENGE